MFRNLITNLILDKVDLRYRRQSVRYSIYVLDMSNKVRISLRFSPMIIMTRENQSKTSTDFPTTNAS